MDSYTVYRKGKTDLFALYHEGADMYDGGTYCFRWIQFPPTNVSSDHERPYVTEFKEWEILASTTENWPRTYKLQHSEALGGGDKKSYYTTIRVDEGGTVVVLEQDFFHPE